MNTLTKEPIEDNCARSLAGFAKPLDANHRVERRGQGFGGSVPCAGDANCPPSSLPVEVVHDLNVSWSRLCPVIGGPATGHCKSTYAFMVHRVGGVG